MSGHCPPLGPIHDFECLLKCSQDQNLLDKEIQYIVHKKIDIGDGSVQLAIRRINSLERSVISKFSVSDSSISYGISEQDVYIISSPSSGKNVVIFMYNEKVDPATCS